VLVEEERELLRVVKETQGRQKGEQER